MTLIGCDPEVFVSSGNGGIVPVCGLLGGSKDAPLRIPYGTLQEDNVCAEIGIDPQSHNGTAVQYTKAVLDQLMERIKREVVIKASHTFAMDELRDDRAWVFGCSPDYNAYTGRTNKRVEIEDGLRCAGGHLHFSCDPVDTASIVQMADVILGIPSVLLDDDTLRRTAYGKAGAFRPKPYGGEYRVLSNFWLSSDEYMWWAYEGILKSVMDCHLLSTIHDKVPPGIIRRTINTGNKEEAEKICQALNLQRP